MARILVVTNMYPPHHYGGYELSCRDVLQRFAEHGHEVAVLTTTTRVPGVDDPPGERAAGIRRDLYWYWHDHEIVEPPPWRRFLMERANQRAIRRALAEVRPDVVSVWHLGAMSWSIVEALVATGLPLLYYVCDDWLVYGPRLDGWTRMFRPRPRLGRWVHRLTKIPTLTSDLSKTGPFLFVSGRTRDLAERRTGWRFERTSIVYSGISEDDFPPTDDAPPRSWGFRLLYVGRIDERKGIETAVRALQHLPEATLDIVGSGDQRELERLRAVAAHAGVADRVGFDSVERSRLAERYRAADVVAFTSVWEEPFGLVPLEAMACGTPVVATGVGGSGEFLADGVNCLLYPPGDAEALADRIRRLADDSDLRAAVVRGGLASVAELTVDRLADVLEEWHLATAERFRNGQPADRVPPGVRT